jgi:hypothetical protein
VKRYREFHGAEPRGKMAAGFRYNVDHELTDLSRKVRQSFKGQFTQIVRRIDLI